MMLPSEGKTCRDQVQTKATASIEQVWSRPLNVQASKPHFRQLNL